MLAVAPAPTDKLFNDIILTGIPNAKLTIDKKEIVNVDKSIWMFPKGKINYHISSNNSKIPPNPSLLDGSHNPNFSFITKMEPVSWCEIVLDKVQFVEFVYIKNRSDKYLKNLKGGKIEVSVDGECWKEIYVIKDARVDYKLKICQEVKYIKLTITNGCDLALRSFVVK